MGEVAFQRLALGTLVKMRSVERIRVLFHWSHQLGDPIEGWHLQAGLSQSQSRVRSNLICPVSQIASEMDPWKERILPTQLLWPWHKVQRQIYKPNEQLPSNHSPNSLHNNELNIAASDSVSLFIINNGGEGRWRLRDARSWLCFPNAATSTLTSAAVSTYDQLSLTESQPRRCGISFISCRICRHPLFKCAKMRRLGVRTAACCVQWPWNVAPSFRKGLRTIWSHLNNTWSLCFQFWF